MKKVLFFVPTIGAVIYVLLYYYATVHYPGGSQMDEHAQGFSWRDNYWCSLLSDVAINGEKNIARPIAITALIILCFSLTCFWWEVSNHTPLNNKFQFIISVCGTISMFTCLLLFTDMNHDVVTNLSALFGLIAMTFTLLALRKNGSKLLFYFGLLNMALMILNGIFYYNKDLILYLPMIQKITFVTFLIWVCFMNIELFRTSHFKHDS